MSRQESSNTFSEGLIKDLNPINTPNTALTDCVNGTIITYDGNEHSLQNDRGNYALENCTLPEGYVPVGTAEYGGIIYIVSYNPIEDKTEIGSYPSTRVVTKAASSNVEEAINSISGGNYTDLAKNCSLKIFAGADPEKSKLYPGDKYKITSSAPSLFYKDEYYVIDENKASHDINSLIETDSKYYKNVSWGIPGWIAVKRHIANIDSFGIGIKSISMPTYIDNDSKVTVGVRFRVIASDDLITESNTKPTISYTISNGVEIKTNTSISCSNSYSLGNGTVVYYVDVENLEFSLEENASITIDAISSFSGIIYDQCTASYTYKLSRTRKTDNIKLGEEIWKYKTFENNILIDFSTEGLEDCKEISDLTAKYTIYNVDDAHTTAVATTKIDDWQFAGMYTTLNIPFTTNFKKENIYVITFGIYAGEANAPIVSCSKLLITTELLNDNYDKAFNFDTLSFADWITKYPQYISGTNIKIDTTSKALELPYEVTADNFEPTISYEGPYGAWRAGNDSTKFNTLLSKSQYKEVTTKGNIVLKSSYNYTKEFKVSTDSQLLTGPLWNDSLSNATVDIWCQKQKVDGLTIGTDGKIAEKTLNINGLSSISSTYKAEALTDDKLSVWTYDKLDNLTSTDGWIKCDVSTIKKTKVNAVGVKISTSSRSTSSEATNSNTDLTLTTLTSLAKKLADYDVMFLKSAIVISADKTNNYGVTLDYDNIYNSYEEGQLNSKGSRDLKYLYFMALPASSSYDKMQIIQLGNNSTTEAQAKNLFDNMVLNFTKIKCYDDEVSGGFVKLNKIDTSSKSTSTIKCDGSIKIDKLQFKNYDLLDQTSRDRFANSIFSDFNVNTNLLKSTENFTEVAIIGLDPIEKTFTLENSSLKTKIETALSNAESLINQRNSMIENQWTASSDPIYSLYTANSITYTKKETVTASDNVALILKLLSEKRPTTNKKATYHIGYWWDSHGDDGIFAGEIEANIRDFSFAFCNNEYII